MSMSIEHDENESSHVEAMPIEVIDSIVPGANRTAASLWIEVFAVLALTSPLWGGHSPAWFVIRTLRLHDTAATFYLPSIARNLFVAVVTLAAIRLSGDPWSAFGIKKPATLDIFTGCLVSVVDFGVTMVGVDLFLDILKSMLSERHFDQIAHPHIALNYAQGWNGFVAILALAISVGFSEELVLRAYLIPRLERLLRSTWVSVLVSAAVFGLLHWQRGPRSVCGAFLGGIVYGIAFAWSRRLWPVAIAHAMYDLSGMLYHTG